MFIPSSDYSWTSLLSQTVYGLLDDMNTRYSKPSTFTQLMRKLRWHELPDSVHRSAAPRVDWTSIGIVWISPTTSQGLSNHWHTLHQAGLDWMCRRPFRAEKLCLWYLRQVLRGQLGKINRSDAFTIESGPCQHSNSDLLTVGSEIDQNPIWSQTESWLLCYRLIILTLSCG